VTAASIGLIVLGTIFALFGLACVLAGALWDSLMEQPEFADQIGAVPDGFATLVLVLGVILLTWGVLEILAGSFALARHAWARIAAIILGILGVLAGLATLLGGNSTAFGVGFSAVLVAGHAFAIWAMASSGRWFSRDEGPRA
jgi:hypothetical protein